VRALEAVPPDGAVTVSVAAAWTDLHDLDATELDDLELRHRSDAALELRPVAQVVIRVALVEEQHAAELRSTRELGSEGNIKALLGRSEAPATSPSYRRPFMSSTRYAPYAA
jgi:hypothetical protein